ncbi:MAG: zinc ribbon domain-containing protein [Candidatus Helarchaeota archaeon]|nr:zinc ribbon domain-containing protein [Candidatus Helarchaeota archaeon]
MYWYKESFNSERRKGTVYCNCSSCILNKGIKRISTFYAIALIFPTIALILSILNLFFNLEDYLIGNMYAIYGVNGVNFQKYLFGHIYNIFDLDFENLLFQNIFGIFSINYAIISGFYIFLILPYTHAIHFANIKRSKILEQLGIKYNKTRLTILTFFTILIISYYSIWYFVIYFGVFVVYTIFNLAMIPLFLLMEYPFRKKDMDVPLKMFSCPHCGEKFSPDSYFCTSCGGYLREPL